MAIRAIYGIEWCTKVEKVFSRRAKNGAHHVRSFMGNQLETCSESGSCNAILLKSSKVNCDAKEGPCNTGLPCKTFYSNKSNPCLLTTGDYIYETSECVCTETTSAFPLYFSNGAGEGCTTCEEGQIKCFTRDAETCQIKATDCGSKK